MKSALKKTFLFVFFLLTAPSVVLAVQPYESALAGLNTSAGVANFDTASPPTVIELIGAAVNVLLSLTGILFLGLIIWAGIRIMFAGGDANNVKKGRDIIINALLGLVLILAAYAITTFLFSEILPNLTGSSGGSAATAEFDSAEFMATDF